MFAQSGWRLCKYIHFTYATQFTAALKSLLISTSKGQVLNFAEVCFCQLKIKLDPLIYFYVSK